MNQVVPDLHEPIRRIGTNQNEDILIARWFRIHGQEIVLESMRLANKKYKLPESFTESLADGFEALPPSVRNILKLRI